MLVWITLQMSVKPWRISKTHLNLASGSRLTRNNCKLAWQIAKKNKISHYSDVIRGRMRLKSPASLLFTKPFIRAQIKENIKAPSHWPLCGAVNSPHKWPVTRKMFPFEYVIMEMGDLISRILHSMSINLSDPCLNAGFSSCWTLFHIRCGWFELK